MEIICSIALLLFVMFIRKYPEWRACNRISPIGKRLDWKKMNYDLASGMSGGDVCKKINHGEYDIPSKF